jgi:hypothetical protein
MPYVSSRTKKRESSVMKGAREDGQKGREVMIAITHTFPPLVLSRSGSSNIEYLFEYSEGTGIHYCA